MHLKYSNYSPSKRFSKSLIGKYSRDIKSKHHYVYVLMICNTAKLRRYKQTFQIISLLIKSSKYLEVSRKRFYCGVNW